MSSFSKKFPIVIIFILVLTTGGCIKNHPPESKRIYFSGICSGFSRSFFDIVFHTYQKNNNVIINGVTSNPETGIRSLREKIIDFTSTDELPDEVSFPGFNQNIIALPVYKDQTTRCLWMLVYKNQAYNGRSFEKYTQLKHFLKYIYSPENQRIINILGFENLPDELIGESLRKIDLMEWRDER
jgi:ABC-type phosphate transport system substrate-binding protein